MRYLDRLAGTSALACALLVGDPSAQTFTSAHVIATVGSQAPQVNPDAVILQDFKKRIDAYVALHRRAVKDGPRLKESDNPAEIQAAQDALAARIRAAHADARPGYIFTPEIRKKFRQLLAPELKGSQGRDANVILKDDAPAPADIPFKVNAPYPAGQPLPTAPPNLLLSLPVLPEELEYRIVGKHLLLRDVQANLVADYMLNAIP